MASDMSETTHGNEVLHTQAPTGALSEGDRTFAAVLSGFGLFVLILTLQPFAGAPASTEGEVSSGNIVNQIGYVLLGGLFLAAMLKLTPRSVLTKMWSPAWLLIFAIAAFSTIRAVDPQGAFRALMLTAITMIVVAGVLVLPATERAFANAATNAVLAILLLVYAVLLVAPHLAVHDSVGVEGGHVGDWKGHLSHKNYAAPVFSMLSMIGIYAWRMGFKLRGLVIAVLGAIFVFRSGSKTTMGFLPVAIGLVFMVRLVGPRLVLFIHAALVVLIVALTVGTVLSPDLLDIAKDAISDPTYTGRDEIWKFAIARINERPWFGYGFVSFWQTSVVSNLEENFEATWDIRGIGSGHNTYLDALLMFGIPGGAMMIFLLMIRPLGNYLTAYRMPANRPLADLFATIVIFMTYVGMLESFFLNRSDPLWVLFAMAVFGLELSSRMQTRQA